MAAYHGGLGHLRPFDNSAETKRPLCSAREYADNYKIVGSTKHFYSVSQYVVNTLTGGKLYRRNVTVAWPPQCDPSGPRPL